MAQNGVLVNGRRVVPYSVPDINNGLTNFVNVDAIPSAAIQRIEVLKDGASAIYGSDAMAGVVNIILRKDFQGGEAGAQLRTSRDGGFGTQSAAVTVGRGDLARDGWNWMATLDVFHRDEVMLRDVARNLGRHPARDVGEGHWHRVQLAEAPAIVEQAG